MPSGRRSWITGSSPRSSWEISRGLATDWRTTPIATASMPL